MPRLHLDYLDGLRALAALFVIAHHAHRTVWWPTYPGGLSGLLVSPFLYGHFSVSVFITLSGFCLMLPVVRGDGHLRGGLAAFFQRRAWRILPPYYLAMLACLALARFHETRRNVLTHLLLVHNLLPTTYSGINGAFWSIAVEWQIYFAFPLLVWGWRRIGAGWLTLATVAVSYVLCPANFVPEPESSILLIPYQFVGPPGGEMQRGEEHLNCTQPTGGGAPVCRRCAFVQCRFRRSRPGRTGQRGNAHKPPLTTPTEAARTFSTER